VGCYIWNSKEEPGRTAASPSFLLALLVFLSMSLSHSCPPHTLNAFLSSHLLSRSNYLTQRYRFSIFIVLLHLPPSLNLFVFLDEFNYFLCHAATTPHEFIITGDFNIHLDNLSDHTTSQFLSLLSSFNLTQHVNFPTHNQNHNYS